MDCSLRSDDEGFANNPIQVWFNGPMTFTSFLMNQWVYWVTQRNVGKDLLTGMLLKNHSSAVMIHESYIPRAAFKS